MTPTVAIVVLHLNDRPALQACLRSFQAVTYARYDLLIVENGSAVPHTLTELQAHCARVAAVVRSPTNVGYTGGNNLGIAEAMARGADYIMLLNDDTEVAPDFLDRLVVEGERSDRIGALGPLIHSHAEPEKIWFAGARFDRWTGQSLAIELDGARPAEPWESDWLTGCCLLMKRRAVEQVGVLDRRFFIYWEDTDWGLRLGTAGWRSVLVPSARIYHKISVTMGGNDSPRKVYHKTRSHLVFAGLHAPHIVPRLLRGFARDIGWLLLKSRQPARFHSARAYLAAIKDYYLGRTGRGPGWLWEPA